jgi:16S rRNA (cytosine1402-N4)-methyltransferase
MLREVIMLLRPISGGIYVDATVGLGGHSEEILKYLGNGILIGIDRDEEALRMASMRLSDSRVILKKGKFSEVEKIVTETGISEVDGILFDLGTSMLHIRSHERGFSFLSDEPLDMRMDKSQGITAGDIINRYSEKDIADILWKYGEERHSRRIAKVIANQRQKRKIETCRELADIVWRAYGYRGKIHPATRTFQALRIEVNDELNELRKGLDASRMILKKGGRLCVISYHSLEDRIVKNFFRDNQRLGELDVITKKPVTPSNEEIRTNPSSRSAKLRGAEKI